MEEGGYDRDVKCFGGHQPVAATGDAAGWVWRCGSGVGIMGFSFTVENLVDRSS